jgi:simple sugar transport system permease protein
MVGAVMLVLGGYDPAVAATELVRGAAGSVDAFLSVTLVRAVPLLLTGLAVALAFRAGVWNIGAEGQLYAGALVAAWIGLSGDLIPAPLLMPAVLIGAALGGAAWAWLPAFLKLRRGVGEVITTLLLNFVAIKLVTWMVRGPLQEPRGIFPQSDRLGEAARLPLLVPGSRLHLGFALAIVAAVAVWFILRWTVFGFRLRALGASPEAATAAGRVDARRLTYVVFLLSGALAGLAGGVEVAGVTYALYDGLSPGHGYTAIAVALLAGLSPLGVLLTGTFFGALEGGAGAMQRTAGIPAAWVRAVEALLILSVLGVERALRRARESLGASGSDGDYQKPSRPRDMTTSVGNEASNAEPGSNAGSRASSSPAGGGGSHA